MEEVVNHGCLERRAPYVPPQFDTVWSNTTNHWSMHHKFMKTFALVLNGILQISVMYNFPSCFVMLATWLQFFRLGYKSLEYTLSKQFWICLHHQCMIHYQRNSIRVQMTHYLWCAIPKKTMSSFSSNKLMSEFLHHSSSLMARQWARSLPEYWAKSV